MQPLKRPYFANSFCASSNLGYTGPLGALRKILGFAKHKWNGLYCYPVGEKWKNVATKMRGGRGLGGRYWHTAGHNKNDDSSESINEQRTI